MHDKSPYIYYSTTCNIFNTIFLSYYSLVWCSSCHRCCQLSFVNIFISSVELKNSHCLCNALHSHRLLYVHYEYIYDKTTQDAATVYIWLETFAKGVIKNSSTTLTTTLLIINKRHPSKKRKYILFSLVTST